MEASVSLISQSSQRRRFYAGLPFTPTVPPGPVSDLLVRTAYTAAYDRRNRIPAWTAEHLNAASFKSGGGDRQSATFREDPDVPERFQAKLLDYFRSGYGEWLSAFFFFFFGALLPTEAELTPVAHPEQTAVTWSRLPTRNSPSKPCRKRSCSPTSLPKSATASTGTTGPTSKRCVPGPAFEAGRPVAPLLLYKPLYEAGPARPRPSMLTVALGSGVAVLPRLDQVVRGRVRLYGPALSAETRRPRRQVASGTLPFALSGSACWHTQCPTPRLLQTYEMTGPQGGVPNVGMFAVLSSNTVQSMPKASRTRLMQET